MYCRAVRINGHGDRHVLDIELVNGFHAQIGKTDNLGGLYRLGDQIGGTADGHHVSRFIVLDRLNGGRTTLGLANHRDESCFLQHHAGELVHARGCRRAGRADHFVAHGINRADVVNDAVGEVDRQFFSFRQHVGNALVCGVAASKHLSVEKQFLARLPGGDLFLGQRVEVDSRSGFDIRHPGHRWPVGELRRFELGWAGAVKVEVDVTGCGTVGNQCDRQIGGVAREVENLDIKHRGQSAQTLRTDAQGVDLFVEFETQFFGTVLGATGLEFLNVDRCHDRFLGHEHGFFRCAADADTDDAGRAPAGAHGGHGFENPVDQVVGGVEHGELGFGFRAAAFGRTDDFDVVAGNDLKVHHGRGVVLGVLARAVWIGED